MGGGAGEEVVLQKESQPFNIKIYKKKSEIVHYSKIASNENTDCGKNREDMSLLCSQFQTMVNMI